MILKTQHTIVTMMISLRVITTARRFQWPG